MFFFLNVLFPKTNKERQATRCYPWPNDTVKEVGFTLSFLCKRFITYTDWNKMNDDISENIMKVFPVTHTAEMFSQQQIFSK